MAYILLSCMLYLVSTGDNAISSDGFMNISSIPQETSYSNPALEANEVQTQFKSPVIKPRPMTNSRFSRMIPYELPVFSSFLNQNPNNMSLVRGLYNTQNWLGSEYFDTSFTMRLPPAKMIVQVVEQGLAVHESFKMYLRELLENVQKYVLRSTMLLSELSIKIKTKYSQLVKAWYNFRKARSSTLKNQYRKELMQLDIEARTTIEEFDEYVKWRNSIQNGISTSL